MQTTHTVWTKVAYIFCLLALLLPVNVYGREIVVHANNVDDRITNGQNATIEELPHIVQISYKDIRDPVCGGFLTSPRHVVTAAHCFLEKIESYYSKVKKIKFITRDNVTYYNIGKHTADFQIIANATYAKKGGISRDFESVYIPKNYNKTSRFFDVAVIKLKEPLTEGEGIQVAELCNKRWGKQETLRIAGWGYKQRSGDKSQRLMTATVNTISDFKCKERLRNIKLEVKKNVYKTIDFTDTMSCALAKEGKDACSGDSGGPAYIQGKVCGIVSFGIECGRGKLPSFYTSVAKTRSFIDAAMKEE